jgi:hypothetical protein
MKLADLARAQPNHEQKLNRLFRHLTAVRAHINSDSEQANACVTGD